MKNRLHAIFTEEGKTNIIVSMYKKGARYKDIASETGLSIPSVRYRLIELSYKGLVDFSHDIDHIQNGEGKLPAQASASASASR
jgi:Mn-dependent DtxR family transcriptional regulator